MRVLVTGANGHLGCNVVRELLRREHEVVAFVRKTSNLESLDGLGLTYAFGDVRDAESLQRAAAGCDAIINHAAVYAFGGTDEAIVKPAVEGIRNVLQAAKDSGAQRVVHTSSIVAVGSSDGPDVLDESAFNERPLDAYMRAKTVSEQRAWELADELSVPLVCLNPAGILGRNDFRATPSTRALVEFANGDGTAIPGGTNYVCVRDVAWVHVEALTKGEPGERYILCGENLDYPQLAELIGRRTGAKSKSVRLPRALILLLAHVTEPLAKLVRAVPPLAVGTVCEFYGRWHWYFNAKARAAFDWSPRSTDAMIDDALAWALHRGLLTDAAAKTARASLGELPTFS